MDMNDKQKNGCVHPEDAWENYWCGDCGDYANNCGCRGPKGEVINYKEKQIEEMARIIAFDLCDYGKQHSYVYGDKAKCYSSENFSECIKIKNVVDKLYEQGYRKIDEGSVVFTQEEYLRMVVEERALDKASEEKARKQAVKEVLQWLTSKRHISDRMHEVGYEKPRTSYLVLDDEIKEIAKEFEVEL